MQQSIETPQICTFCGEIAPSADVACEWGWAPEFYGLGEDAREYGCACERCTDHYLRIDPEACEFVLMPNVLEPHPERN